MPNGDLRASTIVRLDTLESQRKILAGLLARFTADRDMLITTVQACERRLHSLAARVENQPTVDASAAIASPAISEIRDSIAQLQDAQTHATAEARATAAQALARAEDALQRIEGVLSNLSDNGNKTDELLACVVADQDTLMGAFQEGVRRVEAIAERIDAMTATADGHTSGESATPHSEYVGGSHPSRAGMAEHLQALLGAIEWYSDHHERLEAELDRVKAVPDDPSPQHDDRLATLEAELSKLRRETEAASHNPPTAPAPPNGRTLSLVLGAAVGALAVFAVLAVVQRPDAPPSTISRSAAADQAVVPRAPVPPAAIVERSADQPHVASASAPVVPAEPATEPNVAPAAVVPPPIASLGEPSTWPTTLGTEWTTTAIVEPEHKQLCLYRRATDTIANEGCYPIIAAQTSAWPRWLVASDISSERIRLVDETGKKRLKLVPERHGLGPDVAQLRQPDFDVLSSSTTPWRTVWLGADQAASSTTPQEVDALRDALEGWRQAWEQRRLDDYVGFYSASFVPEFGASVSQWRARKASLFEHSGTIAVQIAGSTVAVYPPAPNAPDTTAVVSFDQSYQSAVSISHAFKVLQWQRGGDRWKIRAETVLHESTP
ncbi:MAG: hypothetical protein HYR72_23560 [Deltaproteobacteria bacterium]|nr:hypothetical protein [Deltaproteobacteria bacterium]MBI3389078.1 hypothetical protein [Deltaproteobacteria bacterium]